MQFDGDDSHSWPSLPLAVQYRLPVLGQLIVPQSPAGHVTSHAHELLHVTAPHALPEAHAIVQIESLLHVMSPQAPAVAQSIVHATPDGHVNDIPAVLDTWQVGGFTVPSHESHADGQSESVTQKPLTHARELLHSELFVHASASLLRSTRHALANHVVTSAVPRTIASVAALTSVPRRGVPRSWSGRPG